MVWEGTVQVPPGKDRPWRLGVVEMEEHEADASPAAPGVSQSMMLTGAWIGDLPPSTTGHGWRVVFADAVELP